MNAKNYADDHIEIISDYDKNDLKIILDDWTEFARALRSIFVEQLTALEDDDDEDDPEDRLGNGNED